MCIYELVKIEARLFKYGSGTGSNFSPIRGETGEAFGRRDIVGSDELPRGVRSRRRRDQERRHDAARRQDGLPRHGPPRDCRLHQLEDARGEEGARADRAPATRATSTARPTTRSAGRTRTTRVASPTTSCAPRWPAARGRRSRERQARSARRTTRRTCGSSSRRPRGPAPTRACSTTDDQPLAHLPEHGAHPRINPCSEYMFLDDSACNLATSTSPSSSATRGRDAVRRRWLPPRLPRLPPRPGDPRRSLELPDGRPSRRTATTTARSASATRTSAACSCSSASRTTATRGARSPPPHGHHVRSRVPRPAPRWRRPRGPSPASPRTASRCCA